MAIELKTAPIAQLKEIRSTIGAFDFFSIFPSGSARYNGPTTVVEPQGGTHVNFKPLSFFKTINLNGSLVGSDLNTFENAEYLINLENEGTAAALSLASQNFTATTLNSLFSSLPNTTKTATINVAFNPGAGTCDTSIATNKGYTVITSN